MATFNLPLIQPYHPVTSKDRGLSLPFTAPLLAGARVRPSSRTRTELILPNPSGGRGVYIVPWASLKEICRPTVHDSILYQRISQLPSLTPASVRLASRDVAAEGLAGAEARDNAAAIVTAEKAERVMTTFLLMLALTEQIQPTGLAISRSVQRTPALEFRTGQVLSGIAPGFGMTNTAMHDELDTIGGLFIGLGVEANTNAARVPRLLVRLRTMRADILAWAARNEEHCETMVADSVANSVELIAAFAAATLRDARGLVGNMPVLLRRWFAERQGINGELSRTDWLLDGWETLCLLWETSQPGGNRRTALLEIAQLIPILPRQVADWVECDISSQATASVCRVVSMQDDWRTGGAAFGLVARNERLRAMSC